MSAAAQPASLPRTPSSRHQPPSPTAAAFNTSSSSADRDRLHRSSTSRTTSNPPPASPRRSMSSQQQQQQQQPQQQPSAQPLSASHTRAPSNQLLGVQRHDFEQTNVANVARPRTPPRRDGGHSRTHSRYSEQPTPAPSATNGAASTTTDRSRSSTTTATVTSSPHHLRRRTTIDATTGHWELGKTIGAGSMGKVKLARNKETGEHVAVKIVPRQSSDSEHRSAAERQRADHSKEIRTAREAAIVTLVDHPYICGMRDVVRTNYHWYMLFEYVNGGQMLDYIISHGRLKEKQARKFGRQIASALDYCHRNSIVHRDLKIENILISKTGDIKIIDFGLSNLFSPRSHLKTFCGSLYFAAPELLNAKQYTGPEVDVWSFGIVLYVLVCGKVPFDDQSMPQLHAKIKKGFVEYPPWLTPDCKHLISRMLTTNPAERATLQEIMVHPWMMKGFNGSPENLLPTRTPLTLPLDPSVIEKMTGFDFGAADVITSQLTRIIESEDYQRAVREADKRKSQQPANDSTPVASEKKRGVFDFYKRRNSINSRDTLNTPSSEAVQLGRDPVNAFHPLLSIYYLAREKQEREAREKNPGALTLPQSPNEKPLKVPDLPAAPQAAYTNSQTYEMAGEKPTGGRTRPRARTHGEDEVTEGLQNLKVDSAPNPTIVEPDQQGEQQTPQPARKESTAVGILRRFSTRRHKDSPDRTGDRETTVSHPPLSLAAYGPSETPKKSFSVRRTRDRDHSATGLRAEAAAGAAAAAGTVAAGTPHLNPPSGNGGDGAYEKSSKRSHGLGRSISVNSSDVRRRLTRRGASEAMSTRPPISSTNSYDKASIDQQRRQEAASDVETEPSRASMGGFSSRTRSVGHARRESMPARRARREVAAAIAMTSDVPEETDAELADGGSMDEGPSGRPDNSASAGAIKPVFLRGIFSVSTTSSRPLPQMRADIIRVLRMLGVDYKEIKAGFACRHAPSFKPPQTPQQPLQRTPASGDDERDAAPSGTLQQSSSAPHQRRISFNRMRGTTDRDDFRASYSAGGGANQRPSEAESEFAGTTVADDTDDDLAPVTPRPTIHSPPTPSGPSTAPRAPGETTTHVQSDLGSSLALRFEILLVKVPFLSLHGIQFKKLDGGTWQYKNMAQTILNELRL